MWTANFISRLWPLKTKALLLSALLLAPLATAAGASSVQPSALDLRSVVSTAPISKAQQVIRPPSQGPLPIRTGAAASSRPAALSDAEMDEVSGEGPVGAVVGGIYGAVSGALLYGTQLATTGQHGNASGALWAVVGSAATGFIGGLFFPTP
jgi:uncharacterized membrane protein YeaQ/YmgE (transglycosylase-associated protein family)